MNSLEIYRKLYLIRRAEELIVKHYKEEIVNIGLIFDKLILGT